MSLEHRGIRTSAGRPPDQVDGYVRRALLRTVDGMEIKGTIHIPTGLRIMDLLNREIEQYLAVTSAVVSLAGRTEHAAFLAVNKAHIVLVRELETVTQ